MAKRYVIYKNSRSPTHESYKGGAWDRAGLVWEWRSTYQHKHEAQKYAQLLGVYNPVGFSVAEVEVDEDRDVRPGDESAPDRW